MMIYQIYANVMVMIFFSRPRDGDDDISNIRNCGGDDDVSNIRNYGGDDDVSNICNCGGDDDISNICNCGGDDDIDGDRFVLGLSNISQVRILSKRQKGTKSIQNLIAKKNRNIAIGITNPIINQSFNL